MKPIYITIVGGGFGGIYTLKKFNKIFNKNSNIHITLVSENNYFYLPHYCMKLRLVE